ncbi:MAG: hypothetical protein AAGK01_04980 [Pseudomonadota bacterium]
MEPMSISDRLKSFRKGLSKCAHSVSRPASFAAGLEAVFEDPVLKVTRVGDRSAPNVIVAFTGIRHGLGQIAAEEFVGSSQMDGYSALFVSDMTCSWYNSFGSDQLLEIIAPFLVDKRIVTLGNSRGGFGAIWASQFVGAACTLAFAPQFSVKPEIVPDEKRWMNFRSKIKHWRVDSLADAFGPRTNYITINGNADAEHYRHFKGTKNQTHLLIPNSKHNPASVLKEAGVMNEVIALAAAGIDPFERIRNCGIDVSRVGA